MDEYILIRKKGEYIIYWEQWINKYYLETSWILLRNSWWIHNKNLETVDEYH